MVPAKWYNERVWDTGRPPRVIALPGTGLCLADRYIPITRGNKMEKRQNQQTNLMWDLTSDSIEHMMDRDIQDASYRQSDNNRRRDMEMSSVHAPWLSREPPPEVQVGRRGELLPARGEPGGTDDPLRRGLSGAGQRWYLRYLEQGMHPEVARAKALERRLQSGQAQQPQQQQKRGASKITHQNELNFKKRQVTPATSTSANYAEDTSSIKVAIFPCNPEKILSRDDQSAIEEAIVREMLMGAEHKLKFTGIHFHSKIIVDCVDENTVKWLLQKAPQLQNWGGTPLKACVEDDNSTRHVIRVFFPRSEDLSNDEVLSLINAQNEGLFTSLWKILSCEIEKRGKIMKISINERSFENIKKGGNSLFFRFGKIPVHIVNGRLSLSEQE